MIRAMTACVLFLASASAAARAPGPAPTPAPAQALAPAPVLPVTPAPATAAGGPRFYAGAQVGVFLPQLANGLDTNFGVKGEFGFRVWRNLAIFFNFDYSQPEQHNSDTDPRLAGATWETDTLQRMYGLTIGALWRFLPQGPGWNASIGLGLRGWVLQTVTEGTSGGNAFGTNTELSFRPAGVLQVGGEYGIGPGAIVATAELAGSDLPHKVTGEVANLAILLSAGYRFQF